MIVLESCITGALRETSGGLTDKELWGLVRNRGFERAQFEAAMYRLITGQWVFYVHQLFILNSRKWSW